jgi:multidrug efflux pump subunit AcrA (membrane-fusion protein)
METANPSKPGKMEAKRILLILLAILAFGCRNQSSEFTVMKGPFRQSFTETGELEAISSVAIMVPRIRWEYGYEYKIIDMVDNGKMVKVGDTVIRLDPSTIQKVIISKEEALENEKAAVKKQQVQMDNNIQELQAQLRTEQAMYDLKKLELERSKFDTENKRKIKDLEFRQATIRMEKIKRQLKRKPIMDNYDFKVQKIKELQVQADLEGAKQVLDQLTLTCPKDGLFQAGNNPYNWPPRMLKVGDRAYIGSMIAKIPDIYHMKVRSMVNEADFTKVSGGMKVLVRLDALPDVAFHGKVTDISRICVTNVDKKKVFKVVVEIEESDLRLKPGMTVSCEYISSETDNALYVPNNCLLREGGKYFVYLKNGGTPDKKEVNAGPSNSHHTLIRGGLEPGVPLVPFETVLNKKSS